MTEEPKAVFSWIAPEYEKHQKGAAWFIVAGVLMAGFLAYSIMTGAWTLTVLLALFAVVYLLGHRKKPLKLRIEISPQGVKFGQKSFTYKQLINFWISKLEGKIVVHTKSRLIPQMTILLEGEDSDEITKYLLKHIPEVDEPEPTITENIYRLLGI